MTNAEIYKSHQRHFVTGVFEWRFLLTPLVGKYRCWQFNDGRKIEYQDIYVFGFRVIRWQL